MKKIRKRRVDTLKFGTVFEVCGKPGIFLFMGLPEDGWAVSVYDLVRKKVVEVDATDKVILVKDCEWKVYATPAICRGEL